MNRRKFLTLLAGSAGFPALARRKNAGRWSFSADDFSPCGEFADKGKFEAWFKYYVRPLHLEFKQVYFYKRTHET